MNDINSVDTFYLRPSRTIESILIKNQSCKWIFYVYNYEGNSYRLFKSLQSLFDYFEYNAKSEDLHFTSENALDRFLINVDLQIFDQ